MKRLFNVAVMYIAVVSTNQDKTMLLICYKPQVRVTSNSKALMNMLVE